MKTQFDLQSISTTTSQADSLVASSSTSLGDLFRNWDRSGPPHRLVQNEVGVIDGIVDMRYVQKLLATTNPIERIRWEAVTVGSIAETVFALPSEADSRPQTVDAPTGETAQEAPILVHDNAGCAAVIIDGETFVSWGRISTAMHQNHLDPVTLLPPRVSFNRRMREELDRAARSQQAMALLLIDLDNFKQVNDRYGHRAGDTMLRKVADSLCAGVRSYDFVARFGGDEFTVICYNCSPQEISLPVSRLQQVVSELPAIDADATTQIGLSIGAAVLSRVDERCPPELIVEQADACLYRAKHSGRNTAFAVELDPFGIPLSSPYRLRSNVNP